MVVTVVVIQVVIRCIKIQGGGTCEGGKKTLLGNTIPIVIPLSISAEVFYPNTIGIHFKIGY